MFLRGCPSSQGMAKKKCKLYVLEEENEDDNDDDYNNNKDYNEDDSNDRV